MSTINKPYLSLIIPVYNESERLLPGLQAVRRYLKEQSYRWEIIVVDDGSTIPVSGLKKSEGFRVIRMNTNSGKGAAIRRGMIESKGDMMVFCDIDQSVPVETLGLMLKKLKEFPVVITSRRLRDSKIVVHQKLFRELSGRIFTKMSNILCHTGVADVTCGFKGFRRDEALILFRKQRINRWVFDTEIVFLARKYKLAVRQIAVAWSDKPGSKVRFFDSIKSMMDLFQIRWNDMLGRYEK